MAERHRLSSTHPPSPRSVAVDAQILSSHSLLLPQPFSAPSASSNTKGSAAITTVTPLVAATSPTPATVATPGPALFGGPLTTRSTHGAPFPPHPAHSAPAYLFSSSHPQLPSQPPHNHQPASFPTATVTSTPSSRKRSSLVSGSTGSSQERKQPLSSSPSQVLFRPVQSPSVQTPTRSTSTRLSSPSTRVTRSSARRAANEAALANSHSENSPAAAQEAQLQPHTPTALPPPSRKRKASASTTANTANNASQASPPATRRASKRHKTAASSSAAAIPAPPPAPAPAPAPAPVVPRKRKGKAPANAMAPRPEPPADSSDPSAASASSSRKSSKSRKVTQQQNASEAAGPSTSTRRSKKNTTNNPPPPPPNPHDEDTPMTGTGEASQSEKAPVAPHPEDDSDDGYNDDEEHDHHLDDDDDDDPFGSFGGPGGPGHSLSSTLRALSGMMSGLTARLRSILDNLRQKEDASLQLIALQDLSEILLVSNEDNLSGHFQPDMFVKELVVLMRPDAITGEENSEIMLLACRCLANLMEALPSSVSSVVYGGAVPVLCEKLIEIQYIDIAEQAVSTLEKISFEFPAAIVREGGLVACLSYLDFFPTSTQRTAVTTAANCCRNIPDDSFDTVKGVMPILLGVLSSIDQRVVEQGSICVSRIIESFKYAPTRLEELVSVDILKAILRLLVPGTTNLIGPNIHTQFLRVLVFTARASPRLSAEMFKMNVVETLYQILTGVSPPSGDEDVSSKLDSVVIMQALIHRPRDQIMETLNVICELLPSLPGNADPSSGDFFAMTAVKPAEAPASSSSSAAVAPPRKKTSNDKRIEFLAQCKQEVRRFCLILLPTLTDAFSSTVNLNVRQKVLTGQLKMLSNLDESILTDALKTVPYASFLASILSQQDHPSLVMLALQATELLLGRLDDIYRYQLYREGVFSEITKLSKEDHSHLLKQAEEDDDESSEAASPAPGPSSGEANVVIDGDQHDSDDDENDPQSGHSSDEEEEGDDEADHDEEENGQDEEGDDDQEQEEDQQDDMSGSPVSSRGSTMSLDGPQRYYISDVDALRARITDVAKEFLETHETENNSKIMKLKAADILDKLRTLASDIEAFYLHRSAPNLAPEHGVRLFKKLAEYFYSDVLESVTSAELLASNVVCVLEQVFSNPDETLADAATCAFAEVFMSNAPNPAAEGKSTPFGVMIHKLQDLLSRSEHFEVITVHHNAFDGNRSSAASMLAKQIRLKLVATDENDIPRQYRSIMVSIHAIATFKALDDYLRPRISITDRVRNSRNREAGFQRSLAAMAAGVAMNLPPGGFRGSAASLSNPPPPAPPALTSRAARKAAAPAEVPQTPGQSSGPKTSLRRSSRRHADKADAQTPKMPPPDNEDEEMQNTLECADEKQLSDSDSGSAAGSALDAVVGGLDEEMEDAPTPEPGAVNMEVAAGGRIMARKDDGTRVPTPSQSLSTGGGPPPPRAPVASTPSQSSSHNALASSTARQSGLEAAVAAVAAVAPVSSSSSRPSSYAAALQAAPTDWHIEWSLNDKVIHPETTVYRAVHNLDGANDDHANRTVWSAVHTIKFRRVPGPAAPQSLSNSSSSGEGSADSTSGAGIPASLASHPTTASILRLLKILHELNASSEDIVLESKDPNLRLRVEPLSQFVNTKLTAKLNRQLEEPLIVASNCLPPWSEDLARLYPFLFPFETRHLFLQSTSFGYARSMSRWQNAQSSEETRRDRRDDRPFLGRLQRQKVRISRTKILESALKVMELYGASQSILEVEYFEEVGTGLGPTLEFYATVSKEFSKKKLMLWRENDLGNLEDFVSAPGGLFPRPISQEDVSSANLERILQLFRMLGKFVARSMLDSRIIDINLNPVFFRVGDNGSATTKPSLRGIKAVDPVLARSLKAIKKFAIIKKDIDQDPTRSPAQKVADTEGIAIDGSRLEDLCLDFTLPGYPEIELVPNGGQVRLSIDNVDLFLDKVVSATLGSGVHRQIKAFEAGFSQVFPYSALSAFTPDELVSLFGRVEEDWSLETLTDSIKADHGYNMDSKTVKNLLQVMSELSPTQRREFLQFTTGSPKLPIGGFKSLTPMFTVVCKPSEAPYTSDDYLPSVMTCVNYLKLPDYSDLDAMRRQLFTAIKEGQGAFHLS